MIYYTHACKKYDVLLRIINMQLSVTGASVYLNKNNNCTIVLLFLRDIRIISHAKYNQSA